MNEQIHKKIYWRLLLNTNNPRKARKITKQVVEMVGDCFISQLESYWKDNTMYDFQFEQDLLGVNMQNVVFGLVDTISLLSANWQIVIEDRRVDSYALSGITDKNIAVVGVKWASFMIY
ncbi:MAG: hypothetical protein ACX93T_03320 [Bacteroidota bacterium]